MSNSKTSERQESGDAFDPDKRKQDELEVGQQVEAMCVDPRFGKGYWGVVIVDKVVTEQARQRFVIKWDQG